MGNLVTKVIEPAQSFDLLTLEEAKLMLGIDVSDTSQDAALALQISISSATIAEICNRTFAKEKVADTWRDLGNGRLFLSHWPVQEADIESVVSGDAAVVVPNYELEEASGQVAIIGSSGWGKWGWPTTVTYTGGFELPDEAPLPLKQAALLLIREERIQSQQAQVAGIRQLSHKEARVTFFDPNAAMSKSTSGSSGAQKTVDVLLKQYTRFWV